MIRRHIFPAVSDYTSRLAQTVQRKQAVGADSAAEMDLLKSLSEKNRALYETAQNLTRVLDAAPASEGDIESARYYRDTVYALELKASRLINQLEILTDAQCWPYPTYADILFSV